MISLETILSQQCNISEISFIRDSVINKGKKHYTTKEHLLRSAKAISLEDACFIYKITTLLKPKTVIEIGTWFGTSASIIASASDCTIHTCDKNNVYELDNKSIIFYNMKSSKFLKKIIKKNIVADMCFIDANLKDNDPEMLIKAVPNGVFIVHDYVPGEKGARAVRYLLNTGRKYHIIDYKNIAIMESIK